MSKDRIRKLLDYIPYLILVIYAFILVVQVVGTNIMFVWKHYLGLALLFLTTIVISRSHQLGVLLLGITLLIGFFGQLSLSAVIRTFSLSVKIGGEMVTIFSVQPIFVVCTFIHFVLSRRYYVGIATKAYWRNVFPNSSHDTKN